jgi:hypothetical protein
MKALRSFETSETADPTTQGNNPEDMNLQQHRYDWLTDWLMTD